MTWGTNLTAVDVADQVTNRPFLVASDGTSDPKTGRATFGWLLTDPTGNIMVQCAGPVYGNKPVSYRAEAYGALSPARFLYHIRHFFKLPTIHKYKH
jgi:hypothetical protein